MPGAAPRSERTRRRLDAELVVLGLAATRTRATQLIVAGEVEVDGAVTRKPGTDVTGRTVALIESVDRDEPDYASRGGHKLAGALDDLPELEIRGRRCLDAGASTGGFTDVLLRGGAREVVAVDVGHDQLRPALRRDSRVRVHEGVNVRSLTPSMIGGPVELTVADLSFISLTLVLGALTGCTEPGGDLVVMVKPQFEVGRERLGRGGVVRDAALRADAIRSVARAAGALGWGTRHLARSRLPGPAGNLEYFLWLRRDAPGIVNAQVRSLVGDGADSERGNMAEGEHHR